MQTFDSRSFALGGAQSHRFVPVALADAQQSFYHQQKKQAAPVVPHQAVAPRIPAHLANGEANHAPLDPLQEPPEDRSVSRFQGCTACDVFDLPHGSNIPHSGLSG